MSPSPGACAQSSAVSGPSLLGSSRAQVRDRNHFASHRVREIRRRGEEAGDIILFAVNPGPNRRIADSKIRRVDEQRLDELGEAKDVDRIGSSSDLFLSSS
jgi:hypothetical protein